jgi:protein-S-isoprenylcysteine O-methyltransferase Ste14
VIRLLAAIRSLVYGAGFVLLWGWIALQVAKMGGGALPALPATARPAGAALMVLGGLLALWCVAAFVVEGRGTPAPFDPPRALVPVGPYRWVRNPMYLGGFLVMIGFGVWRASLAIVLLAVPFAVFAHLFVVLYEERTLERQFGIPYIAYRALVNRWLPKRPSPDLHRATSHAQ